MNPCDHSIFCHESDFENWPHDSHKCYFEYISRTRNSDQMTFDGHSVFVDEHNARESDGFIMLSAVSKSGERQYLFDGFNSSHPFVIFSFEIQRLPHGYILQVIIPAVVVMILNICLLLLSPLSPERFILYAVNLFSHCIFFEQLRWM